MQTRHLRELEGERKKLLDAHYADAIPLVRLKGEQDHLTREVANAEERLAAIAGDFTKAERNLERALARAGDCAVAYEEAGSRLRRRFNMAFFERIPFGDDGTVESELAEPFDTILGDELRRATIVQGEHELREAVEQEERRPEVDRAAEHTLQQAVEGWLAERKGERGLKRSMIAGYEDMFERLYRDLGADTPVRALVDGRLRAYFVDFKAYRVLREKKAREALSEGKNVHQITIERWTAQPPESQAVEVATKDEAVRLADELPGTWKHRRRGCYRVVPLDAQRPRRISRATATALQAESWIVKQRRTRPWMLVTPAAAQTRNTYRDILAASFDYAVREGWLEANPLAVVKRASKRHDHERILRRDDFYDPDEIDQLLRQAPGVFEEAFWLCGAHAGLRLPGEALGRRRLPHGRDAALRQLGAQ